MPPSLRPTRTSPRPRPWWHAGDPQVLTPVLGYERARKLFRCKTVWDSGALVTWSSDNVVYDFPCWNPFLGVEAAKGSITAGKDADFLVFE
ncbi:MAG: hypothetical protein IJQ61_10255 [Bacteroidales bacterium]|nr:hypothetical protein [Bacteroidales bacterium]